MCRSSAAVVFAIIAMLGVPGAAVGQDATPLPCPPGWEPPDRSVVWETASATLEADAIEMRRGDCVFIGVGPADVDSDPGDPTYRTLEVVWDEQGARLGLNIYFAADETHWWVTEIRTPAGEFHDDPSSPDRLSTIFRTPRGETFEGDVHLEQGRGLPGVLTIEGLRLTAFAKGTGPAPLTDCKPATTDRKELRGSPMAKGQPLHGSGIGRMSPQDAESLLRGLGICFTFRYGYPVAGTDYGYSERWCTSPPAGVVGDLTYLPDGELVVFIHDELPRAERPQPPEGWNCPVQ